MEILIVILVFVLPVLSVIFDKKKRKGVPRVKSKRIIWPADKPVTPQRPAVPSRPAPARPTPARTSPARPAPAVPADMPAQPEPGGGTITSNQPEFSPAVATACTAAGTPTSRQTDAQVAAASFVNSARSTRRKAEDAIGAEKKKEYSEKQKLIIYSEILKPKFDE